MGRVVYSDRHGTKVTLEMPKTHQAIADLGLNPTGAVQEFVTRRAAERMDKYVPFRTGVLRETVDYTTDATAVIYDQPYARYQYFGVAMEGTPRAPTDRPLRYNGAPQRGSFWDEKMMAAEGEQYFKEIQDYSDEYSDKKEV